MPEITFNVETSKMGKKIIFKNFHFLKNVLGVKGGYGVKAKSSVGKGPKENAFTLQSRFYHLGPSIHLL